MSKLPDKLLIGRKFWRGHGLILDLEADRASICKAKHRCQGPLGWRSDGQSDELQEAVRAVIEDADVDHSLQHMDFREFSPHPAKQNRLRKLLWKRRDIFKGLGKIKGVNHIIALKPGAMPVCEPIRRRSPKEEEVERAAMEKLLKMGVVETEVAPWAANNVFVTKKGGVVRVTSDFRRLNDLTITDSYPMENVRNTLDWLASKKVLSVFDLKDGFYQVELDPSSKACMHSNTYCVGTPSVHASTAGIEKLAGYFSADTEYDPRRS